MQGRTVVMISHNISEFYRQACDKIICMRRGKNVQSGTHAELMGDSDGLYAELVNSGVLRD